MFAVSTSLSNKVVPNPHGLQWRNQHQTSYDAYMFAFSMVHTSQLFATQDQPDTYNQATEIPNQKGRS